VPVLCSALLCGLLWAQQPPQHKDPQAPPEEDEELQPAKEYTFNPLQAEKELKVGNYYFKKGSYKAAANRFREATRWNSGLAEAYVRLGDAEEKRKDLKAAREAYAKFLELAPADKRAGEIKKKLDSKR
jgi:outer membrane protein assembly factor BamD (BamD/ComL family)